MTENEAIATAVASNPPSDSLASPSVLRVLIVAENASEKFGGESIIPLHYFRHLRKRGIETWMVAHDRTRDELASLLPEDAHRIVYVPDTKVDKFSCRVAPYLPKRLHDLTFSYVSRQRGMLASRRLARKLIAEHGIHVVHQPIPVSPREPSMIHGLGVPVVIGPMNGAMSFPDAFAGLDGWWTGLAMKAARGASAVLNRVIPGKLRADVLLVANDRTRRALPRGARGQVELLPENGVDLSLWHTSAPKADSRPARFLFIGRLVDWKGVDLLLEAFRIVRGRIDASLEIIGEGSIRGTLESQARDLGLSDSVRFVGWVSQRECAERLRATDALVLPSLYECGGAVVLEAMACGRAVIATNWGGPADYLDESCGILVEPTSRTSFIDGLASAMTRIAGSSELRETMGQAGRARVVQLFDWERKVDRILEIYARLLVRVPSHSATSLRKEP
jgi:glycosyltransferase involved in cell wall biosynthesis